MRSNFVVMLNPSGDLCLGFLVGLESMLPHALELQRTDKRFGDAILLRRVRKNELLMKAVGPRQIAIQLGSVDQRVVGP